METNLHNYLQGIADAIKEKTGDTTINAQDFASKIASIEAGGGGDSNALVEAILGRTITEYVSDSSADIGKYAFQGCDYLTKISLPNVLSLSTGACYNCTALAEVFLPKAKWLSTNTFYGCAALTNVNLPSLMELSNASFQNCTSLKKADLGTACKKIGAAFIGCSALEVVIMRYTSLVTIGNQNIFLNTPIATATDKGFIYVPSDLVDSYKAHTNWSTFAAKIKSIDELPNE